MLLQASEVAILLIQFLALLFVAGATLALLLDVARLLLRRLGAEQPEAAAIRRIWLDYARWLIAALTLQLGADILESAIAPGWEAIAQLGAVAAIRTFLNYFLEKDVKDVRDVS
nr:DUF1622 domain-containing protein [Sandaracinobacteroides sayramensis]